MELPTIVKYFTITLSFLIIILSFYLPLKIMRGFWKEMNNGKDREFIIYSIVKTVIAVSLFATPFIFI